jgi:uroporphyrinogen III methyltransferase/synthase
MSISPLSGKRVVITRALSQADSLVELLNARGAEPLLYPCLDFVPLENTAELDRALTDASHGDYDWLVLTSANTVYSLKSRLDALGIRLRVPQVAAVGSATAESAQQLLGLKVNCVPEDFRSAELARAIDLLPGARVLLPKADISPKALARALEARGAMVHPVIAYRTVIGTGGINLPALLGANGVDVITLASPSAVRHLIGRLEAEGGSQAQLANVTIACIGPETRGRAVDCGLQVAVTPPITTLESLVQSLEAYYA